MPFTRLRQSLIQPNGSITGSMFGTASYSITSSYALNVGTSLTTGSTYPITSSWSNNSLTSSWSNNALTASYAINSISVVTASLQTGSIASQTLLYNVTTSQDNTISGLNLSGNKWGVTVIEEWNSGSVVVDAYYNSCSVLMHFSGSNNSTIFTDNSPSPKTFVVNGNSKISTVVSKFGSSSVYFDGTGDYLGTTASSNDYAFGTGDFTIEFWAYKLAGTDTGMFQISSTSTGLNANTLNTTAVAVGGNVVSIYANNNLYNSTVNIDINQWYHYALVRSSGVTKLYVNGDLVTSIGTFGSITDTTNYTGTYLAIGGYYSTSYLWNGYIDEFRITKGVARYTSNFTIATEEFPNSRTKTQNQTKYIGLVGGLNDSNVDYGIEKLSDSSLKIRKISVTGQPLSGSGTLSASVDRVYVNVLNYDNVSVSGSITNSTSASYALSASYADISQTASYYGGSVISSSYSITSSYIRNAVSSSYSLSSSYAPTNLNITASYLTTTNNYTVSSLTSSNINALGIVNINSSGSTSSSTNGSLSITGQNTKGGSGYHDFLYISNTAVGTLNPYKFFRLNTIGDIEIINSSYGTNIFTLSDSGSLQLPVAQASNVTQLRNTGGGLKVGNYGYFFDDGNVHIHSTAPGNNLWLNCSGSGKFVVNGQTGATGGMCIGTDTQKGFVTIVGSVSAAITQPYGYLISSGAGSTTGTSPNPYSLTCDNRVMSSEFNVPSDERLKDIKGEISLNKAIDLVTKITPIEFTWKDGVDSGLKAGYSAQQTYKAGFEHLLGVVNRPGLESRTDGDGFVSPQDAQFVMNYEQVIPYHSKLIKHLLDKVEQLESKIRELEQKSST